MNAIVLDGGVRLLVGTRRRFLGYQTFLRRGDVVSRYRMWSDGDTQEEIVERIGMLLEALATGKIPWPQPVNRGRHNR
jgi:hypothetical protein